MNTSRRRSSLNDRFLRREITVLAMTVICIGVSTTFAFQDVVRWSKDYIYAGKQLVATVQSATQNQPNCCRSYVPMVAKGQDLATAMAIQNTSKTTVATATIRYVNQSGVRVATLVKEIQPRQSIFIEHNATGSGLDAFTTWRGSAIVESSVPLSVVVNVYATIPQ